MSKAAQGITFTGKVTDSGYDLDRNGLLDFLQVGTEIEVIKAGWFGVTGALTTWLVAIGGLTPDPCRTAPATSKELKAGVQIMAIYFDGRAIRSSGADGPFAVTVAVSSVTGSLVSCDLSTRAYKHLDFQGPLVEVLNIRDEAVDTDKITGDNLLRLAVSINVLAAGKSTIQAQLFAGDTFIGDMTQTSYLEAGRQTVNLDFASLSIAGSGMDGPFTVYLAFSDAYNSSNVTFETKAYRHQQFQLPGALFTGSVRDGAVDTNGNNLYEQLYVKVELVATRPAQYILGAILQDKAGRLIQRIDQAVSLETAAVEVALLFESSVISGHGADRPSGVTKYHRRRWQRSDAPGVSDQAYLSRGRV